MGADIEIRPARVGDAVDLASAWQEFGRYYVGLDPDQFRVPEAKDLPAWFESRPSEDRGDDWLWLVAARDGHVIGFVEAQILPPAEDAHRQLRER